MAAMLRPASTDDAGLLLPLVRAYHAFEGIGTAMTDDERIAALQPLLEQDAAPGRIWLIQEDGNTVGYLALCFGYSIEFGGRDAFIDEFFIRPESRGQGIGSRCLELVKAEAQKLGVAALHLIADRNNAPAQRLYASQGFMERERFQLLSCALSSDQTPVRALNGEA